MMCLKFLAFLGIIAFGVLALLGLGLFMLNQPQPLFPPEPVITTSDPAMNAQLFIEAAVANNIEEALLYVCDAEVETWRQNLTGDSVEMTINNLHCIAEGETATCTLIYTTYFNETELAGQELTITYQMEDNKVCTVVE
jgi:hypothetical protein